MVIDNNRVNALLERQFKRDLEIFIFYLSINTNKEYSNDDLLSFASNELHEPDKRSEVIKIINNYTYALQLENENNDENDQTNKSVFVKTLKEIDDYFEEYFIPEKIKEFHDKFYKGYHELFSDKLLNDLKKVYDQSKFENSFQCHYCGITENLIKQLINDTKVDSINTRNRFFTKRFFYGRGKSMEIDQIDPNLGYYLDNMVLACYWCNNAKSDEFNYEEFKDHIAPAIRKIWKDRLIKLPKAPDRKKRKIMKFFEINNFKETLDALFDFFETNNIPCHMGSFDELKELMDLVYEAELVSWECAPSYPSLSIDFTLSCDFEFDKVFNFLFRDTGSQRENSVLIDLSSRDNSVSFIRFEIYSPRYLPFLPGLPESMGSMEASGADGIFEKLNGLGAGEIMSLTEFGAFLSRHPVPGELTLVEVD